MERTIRLPVLAFITGIAFGVIISGQIAGAQQATAYQANRPSQNDLDEIKGSEMNVWLGELAPGAATGKHTHPTPRFVYVLEGAVVLEMCRRRPSKLGRPLQKRPTRSTSLEMPVPPSQLKHWASSTRERANPFRPWLLSADAGPAPSATSRRS